MRNKIVLAVIVFLAFLLRVYRLGEVPPALYWDEASLGYNAYSIATTLHDEHGNFLPISSFPAFGDYKPPGYVYVDALAIKLFGLSEFSIRLPSALAGTLLVLVTYFLTSELLAKRKKVALLATLFVAVSPWTIQMSRGAFEANLATLFSATGVLFFLRALRQKSTIAYCLSATFFAASLYTFNSHRVAVPLFLTALSFIFIRPLLANWKKSLIFYLLFIVLLVPLVPHLLSTEGKLRFNEVTWLNDLSLVEKSNQLITANDNAWWAKIIYNRRVFYSREFLAHYADHFRGNFLFTTGDINPRLSIQTIGEFYLVDSVFLILGLLFLPRFRSKATWVILSAILLGIIPAALARETPHDLRILPVLPFPQIMIAVGLGWIYRKKLALVILFVYVFFLLGYLYSYYLDYPAKYSSDWQYGYRQAVEYVSQVQDKYDHINVTGRLGRAYIYFLLYNQYPPEKYWQNRTAEKDRFGFWSVSRFDKYVFDGATTPSGKWLYMRTPEDTPTAAKVLKSIYNPNRAVVFNFYDSF